jgi:hypothetical protein
VADAARKKGLDPEEAADLLEALGEDFARILLDLPFQPFDLAGVPMYGRPTRFSDGTFPVFYASGSAETSEREVRYHCEKDAMSNPDKRLPLRFCVFYCDLAGDVVDLRLKWDEWDTLTSVETEDAHCLALGQEAFAGRDPDAFLAPSARHGAGTTTPTFKREALANAVVDRLVRFTFDTRTGHVTVTPA